MQCNILKEVLMFIKGWYGMMKISAYALNVCTRLTFCSSPHQHEQQKNRRRCLQSCLQTSALTPQKSYPKFWNPKTTFLGSIFPFFVSINPQ